MNAFEHLVFALRALIGSRARAGLSLLGVAIGVAAVILLTALGEGARRYVTGQFTSLGTNIVIIVPGYTETTGTIPGIGGVPNDLTIADAEALDRRLPQLDRVSPACVGEESISHLQKSRRAMVLGATAELLEIRELEMDAGSFLPDEPWDRGSPVVVLGRGIARELFGAENPVGASVRVGEWRMRVIGVLRGRGTHLGMDMDEAAIVPVATGMRMFDRSSLFRILARSRSHAELAAVGDQARAILIERHGEEDVTVLTQDAVVSSLSAILGVLTLAVAGIGAISLGVAGIGIMNVMLVAVSERTPEVGLLKAIGAGRGQILAVFLVESALISFSGGVLGLAGGWLGTRAVVLAFPTFPATPPAWSVGASLGLALVVGIVFGLIPAGRATRLDPVEALRK